MIPFADQLAAPSLERLLASPRRQSDPATDTELFIAGVRLSLASDDPAMVDEFTSVFGGRTATARPEGSLAARLRANLDDEDLGVLEVHGDEVEDAAAFLLSISSDDIPIRESHHDSGWTYVLLGDHQEPVFACRGRTCVFRKVPRWLRILSHYLFLRALRVRNDALFFHAASISIDGRGVLIVGPKGTGKTTLSSTLGARGHSFLGDETACYLPASNKLIPFRRPLAIKPGVRSREVDRRLSMDGRRQDEDGVLRVPPEDLGFQTPPHSVPLGAVVFLRGFQSPALQRVEAGREELSSLQPMTVGARPGSTMNHVFNMIRLLGSVPCYSLTVGAPDETAVLIEEELRVS